MGRGDTTVPVVESWTILSMAAARHATVTVGPFVLNVMNRHPAVLARMASTLQIASGGRLVLGIGIGGAPREHEAYGIDFPEAPERVARLEEAVAVHPGAVDGRSGDAAVAVLPAARGVRPPGAGPAAADRHRRRDARPAPGWPAGSATAGRAFDDNFEANLPVYLESLEAAGRRREDQRVIVGFQGDWLSDERIADSPWVTAPRETWARWHEAGADGAIVLARTTEDVDALVAAADRW